MFLSDLKPLFDKFNSLNNIYNIDSESAMKRVEECAAICTSFIKKFDNDNDNGIYWKLLYFFGHKNFCQPATSRDIKSVPLIKSLLLDEIDIKKEILLRRIRNKSQIGTLDELPNHIIDSIYEKIIE